MPSLTKLNLENNYFNDNMSDVSLYATSVRKYFPNLQYLVSSLFSVRTVFNNMFYRMNSSYLDQLDLTSLQILVPSLPLR